MFKELVYGTRDSTQWRSVLPAQDNVFASVEFALSSSKQLRIKPRFIELSSAIE